MLSGGLALFGGQAPTYIKAQTVGLQADRVSNAAMALDSIPEGYVRIPIDGYSFNYEGGKINLSVMSQWSVVELDDSGAYNEVIYSSDKQEIEEFLCLVKSEESSGTVLEFRVDNC